MKVPDELARNAILGQLPRRELDPIRELGEVLESEPRQKAYDPGGPISHVYFPLDSVFSMVAVVKGQAEIEVATIGREGMAGLPVFLGAPTSPHACFCQVSGTTVRLDAQHLRRALGDDGKLHGALNRFTQATMVQIAQNVICNASHPVEQRAARWLLTTHDRVARDEFFLTQEFLSQMLGARRPTVSAVARELGRQGLISYKRGTMVIRDRSGLERTACPCYGIVRREFDTLTR